MPVRSEIAHAHGMSTIGFDEKAHKIEFCYKGPRNRIMDVIFFTMPITFSIILRFYPKYLTE